MSKQHTTTDRANARLMAAAPDLLEALKDLVARCDGEEGVRADGSNIDTAWAHGIIAKAEGGDACAGQRHGGGAMDSVASRYHICTAGRW